MPMRVNLLRLPAAAICFVALAILASCGGPPIALNGTITDAYTGKPVSAAKLMLGTTEIATDAGGNYQFPQWSEKDTLQVTASGYEPLRLELATQPQFAQ
ncbi:MAG TPA: carboxypeptidase regulatory-like domain-containing protein, partial [Roseiflexaceae bacterium]|nr:carboxypeptidase regulatory-like domain-containing protein [Roseiflexaceae bacterium]